MADEDNRLKSNRTWIKWTKLEDGLSLEYHNNWYKKPGDEEDLKSRIRLIMACNDRAKQKKMSEELKESRSLNFIEKFVETPVGTVSVGPDRNATFNRVDPWA